MLVCSLIIVNNNSSRLQRLYEQYQRLAAAEEAAGAVHFVGRLATYKYINMDEAILNALETVDQLYGCNSDREDDVSGSHGSSHGHSRKRSSSSTSSASSTSSNCSSSSNCSGDRSSVAVDTTAVRTATMVTSHCDEPYDWLADHLLAAWCPTSPSNRSSGHEKDSSSLVQVIVYEHCQRHDDGGDHDSAASISTSTTTTRTDNDGSALVAAADAAAAAAAAASMARARAVQRCSGAPHVEVVFLDAAQEDAVLPTAMPAAAAAAGAAAPESAATVAHRLFCAAVRRFLLTGSGGGFGAVNVFVPWGHSINSGCCKIGSGSSGSDAAPHAATLPAVWTPAGVQRVLADAATADGGGGGGATAGLDRNDAPCRSAGAEQEAEALLLGLLSGASRGAEAAAALPPQQQAAAEPPPSSSSSFSSFSSGCAVAVSEHCLRHVLARHLAALVAVAGLPSETDGSLRGTVRV
jgi:hypothetical protein